MVKRFLDHLVNANNDANPELMRLALKLATPFISALALREKQIQQNYRPIIAVHKWFARRPGTLFRGLLLAEFSDRPLQNSCLGDPIKVFKDNRNK